MLGFLRTKIEYTLLNPRPFEAAFSGIGRVRRSPEAGIIYIYFISDIFVRTLFEPAKKIMII